VQVVKGLVPLGEAHARILSDFGSYIGARLAMASCR
jgi:hypothetical protein